MLEANQMLDYVVVGHVQGLKTFKFKSDGKTLDILETKILVAARVSANLILSPGCLAALKLKLLSELEKDYPGVTVLQPRQFATAVGLGFFNQCKVRLKKESGSGDPRYDDPTKFHVLPYSSEYTSLVDLRQALKQVKFRVGETVYGIADSTDIKAVNKRKYIP